MVKINHVLLIVWVDAELYKSLKKDKQIIYLILSLFVKLQVIFIKYLLEVKIRLQQLKIDLKILGYVRVFFFKFKL